MMARGRLKRVGPGEPLQVHPSNGRSAVRITGEQLAMHGDDESPHAFWQHSCVPHCLLRSASLRVLSGKAAALGVERLWSAARNTLTGNRRSMLTHRLMQLHQDNLNLGLLSDSACLDSLCVQMLLDDHAFQSFCKDLEQFEEAE
jgi:hypothetical protein